MNDKLSGSHRHSWTIICLAYVFGLLSTSFFGFPNLYPTWQQWTILITSLGLLSIVLAIIIPRFWYTSSRTKVWLLAGIIAIFAVVYFQMRIPHPGTNDISNLLKTNNHKSVIIAVKGNILSQARLTANQRIQFWFKAQQVKQTQEKNQVSDNKLVTGKLYVTVPNSQGINFYPGQQLEITGVLYQPKSTLNPGSFDFKSYLIRYGAFAGLKGLKILKKEAPPWGFWKLRQRITLAQSRWLREPESSLVSSIVLGKQAVNLPTYIREQFTKAGLSHVLVASGFQISILLGVVISLTRYFAPQVTFIIGLIILFIYVGLTGVEPSIMRAALMGIGALVALIYDRKVRILGAFLLAGTLLLLFNPLWIWDLSFQLSFLATLGLIVTLPALEKKLDWLPPAIATLMATPIAASIWTLPLLIYVFNLVAVYSIPANIITAPLIIVISLGGMISAVATLILPIAGSAVAWLLAYPTHLLIEIVRLLTTLPGSSLATGKISLSLLLLIYLLFGLVWVSRFWQRRWCIISLFIITLVSVPIVYKQLTLVQVTVLATSKEPVLVIQERGTVILINSGDAASAKYIVIPFLNRQGIRHIDCAIAFKSKLDQWESWSEIQKSVLIKNFLTNLNEKSQKLTINEKISIGSTAVQLLSDFPALLQFRIQRQNWLLLAKNEGMIPDTLKAQFSKSIPPIFLWSGQSLDKEWLKIVNPKIAIAPSNFVSATLRHQLQQQHIKLYWLGRDGAIQWTPDRGLQTFLKETDQSIF